MSDDRLLEVADAIRYKEKLTIRFRGTCNSSGSLSVSLNPPFRPKRQNATYTISLITFAATNMITNLDETCNKFYYSVGTGEVKTLTLFNGFYTIETYNEEIKGLLKEYGDDPEAITVSMKGVTGLVDIKLSKGYKVYFNRDKTWRKALGFEAVDLVTNGTHKSSAVADFITKQEIYVHCSACRGNILIKDGRRKESDIIFNFPVANAVYGSALTFQIDPRLTESELDLSAGGQVDHITLKFTDDTGEPVTFANTPVSAALRIVQV